ncbi:hypothetical protein B1H18_09165 [Streptomyces tsukubensis]|uniref:Bulb-type lectin domain-containing protein n=1 Tax=Streptomyces tsukubensis TaxID=83656 RepID=A0A1V4AC04_9ACTN|nr:hypothetical protein B1H18_09165 [Streptomyces tsukubensis]
MPAVSSEGSVFVYRLRLRAPGSAESSPAPPLLVHVDDGMKSAPVPVQLSWTTQDGSQSTVGFSPDMESLYGQRRAPGGDVVEVLGALDDRREYALSAGRTSGYEFSTEVEDAGRWSGAGRLRVLVDDGGRSPVRWVSWCDQAGNTWSVALHAVSPTGNEDVTGLVSDVWASAEHRGAGEVAANLLDARDGKWFAPERTAVLDFRLSQPIEVDQYALTSANDAPDRDPAAWTLSGSTDGKVWRTVDVRDGESFTTRHQRKLYRIAEPGVYDRYRLEITGNNGSPHLQLETVRFLADGGGGFTGYRRRAGYALHPYRGTRVARPQVLLPRPLPERAAEWEGWRPGGSWLPLGGSLSMESLTSTSGRFTVLHGVYDPPLAIRDNLTGEHVWVSDAGSSSLLSLGPDGDLVAWDHHGQRVWSTGTAWRGVRRLEMRDTGELALTDADGGVVWSSGIPEISVSSGEPRTVARGARMRRGESLYGQTLTSDDGSTVLFHDGRVLRCVVKGHTSHWDRYEDQQNVLVLDAEGFLRRLAPDGSEVERIAGPGAELVVVRGAAVLRDDTGVIVWSSEGGARPAPVREPALPHNDTLAAWFGALVGQGHGYCVAVVKQSTPAEVLARIGVASGAAVRGTWRQLQRHRDAVGEGSIAAAVAVGPDVILLSDDAALPVARAVPSAPVAAVRAPSGGNGYGTRFSLHQRGKLVSEFTDQPRRTKGAKVPEVAAALNESTHHLHRFDLLFRVCGVVPNAAGLGGVLLGGVLSGGVLSDGVLPGGVPVPHPTPEATPEAEVHLPALVIAEHDQLSPLVIRADFTDDDAWNRVVEGLREPWMDVEPDPYLVSDPAYDGMPAERIIKAVLAAIPETGLPGVVFVADADTMRGPTYPLLAVSTEWDGEPFAEDEDTFRTRFRVRPDAAIEASCNLGLGNMDFEDFAGDGVTERMAD